MKVLFEDDIDVLYVESKELTKLMCKVKMTYQEFWCAKLNMLSSKMDRKKYDFFKYLYNVYVKDKDILKMIDTYDVKEI